MKIDFGIRYEHNQNLTDANNQIAAIDTSVPGGRFVLASAASANLALLPIPYVTAASIGWNNSLLSTKPLRLAPRAGLAWSPGNSKTVFRAGFGIYPNQAAYSIVTNLAQNLPFFVTKTVNSPVALAPTFNTENALATNALGTVGGNNLDHNFKIEYNEVWNFNLEREITSSTVLSQPTSAPAPSTPTAAPC